MTSASESQIYLIHEDAHGTYCLIHLTQGQSAKVDVADYWWATQWKRFAQWSPGNKSFYAGRNSPTVNGKRGVILMHREIVGASIWCSCGPRASQHFRQSPVRITNCYSSPKSAQRKKAHRQFQRISWRFLACPRRQMECLHKCKRQTEMARLFCHSGSRQRSV